MSVGVCRAHKLFDETGLIREERRGEWERVGEKGGGEET